MLLHLPAAFQQIHSQPVTPWHRLTPQTRILCTLIFVFATALTPNGRWLTWAVYGVGLAIVLALSRISLPLLLQRLAIEFGFVGVVIVGALFHSGGAVVWQWGWLQITTEGLITLGSVTLKACLCLLCLNLLALSTPVPALLAGLSRLKVPPLLIAIFASMYRYIGVLMEEFRTMRWAAASRNLMNNARWHRLVVGNMIGSLFIRTYDRGDRIHQAMLARGYSHLPVAPQPSRRPPLDLFALVTTMILVAIGQLVYW